MSYTGQGPSGTIAYMTGRSTLTTTNVPENGNFLTISGSMPDWEDRYGKPYVYVTGEVPVTMGTTETAIISGVITPTSVNSKIFVWARAGFSKDGGGTARVVTTVVRFGQHISDVAVTNPCVLQSHATTNTTFPTPAVMMAIHSPNTVETTGYFLYGSTGAGTPDSDRYEMILYEL